MRKKCNFEKFTDAVLVGSFVGLAFMAGFKAGVKYMEKRGAVL